MWVSLGNINILQYKIKSTNELLIYDILDIAKFEHFWQNWSIMTSDTHTLKKSAPYSPSHCVKESNYIYLGNNRIKEVIPLYNFLQFFIISWFRSSPILISAQNVLFFVNGTMVNAGILKCGSCTLRRVL